MNSLMLAGIVFHILGIWSFYFGIKSVNEKEQVPQKMRQEYEVLAAEVITRHPYSGLVTGPYFHRVIKENGRIRSEYWEPIINEKGQADIRLSRVEQ